MDFTIIATFFSFISLVICALIVVQVYTLANKLDAYLDHAIGHTESLRTMISQLNQIESKQDLMFNNAPPAPGETFIKGNLAQVEGIGDGVYAAYSYPSAYHVRKLKEHQIKVKPEKKKRPPKKKASKSKSIENQTDLQTAS